MRNRFALTLAAALLLSPVAAFGHAPPIGVHGGMQTHAGPLHQEIVIGKDSLTVYLNTMEEKPVDTAGATGTVTLLIAGAPAQVALAPAGPNSLSGKLDRAVPPATKIATTVTLAGKGPITARYEVPVPEAAGGHEGHQMH